MERLILDTTVLVSVERTASSLDAVIDDEDDVAIAAITAAELLVGVELALAHVRRSGRPRGAHDLLIAATALTHGRTVVSADLSGFAGLPGLRHAAEDDPRRPNSGARRTLS